MSSQEPLADDAEQSRDAQNDDLVADTAPTKNGDNYTNATNIPLDNIPLDVTIEFHKSDLKLRGSKAALIAGSNFFRDHFEDVRTLHLRAAIISKQTSKQVITRPPSTQPNAPSPRRKLSNPE
jgi:hypothetical protein